MAASLVLYPPSLPPPSLSRSLMTPQSSSIPKHFPMNSSQASVSETECSDRSEEYTPSPPSRPQLEIRTTRRGFGVVGLLSTICVFVVTGGTATLILVWLHAFQDSVAGDGGFVSALRSGLFVVRELSARAEGFSSQPDTETLRILLFSALASHLASVTSTILVTLLAFRAATQWLRASDNPDHANLTPIQYGLLVRTLGSGSLMSILNTIRYTSRSRRASAPRFFKEAVAGVTAIYLLGHVVGLLDLWLHSRARSTSITRAVPIESDALYGITYNEARCGPFNKTALPCQELISTVGNESIWGDLSPWIYLESFDTISDVNPYKTLEYINGTAILVPGPAKNFKSQGFTFSTQGLRVECEPLRDQCDRLPMPLTEFFTPGATPVTNCSKAGYPRIPYYTSGVLKESGRDTRNIKSLVMGIIGDEMGGMFNGTADFSSGWTSNPASTVVQLRWDAAAARNTPTPGVMYLNYLDLYATCNMTYLDIVAQYDPIDANWTILEEDLSSPELASVLWTPMIFQLGTENLINALRPYITNRGGEAMGMLELLMAKYGMGFAAPLTTFVAASNLTTTQLVTLGLYPTTPTLLLVSCLYIYSIVALTIFVLACTSNNRMIFVPRHLTREGQQDEERAALDVAQSWLTDPLPFIGAIFPGRDGRQVTRSVEGDPIRQVYDSDWDSGRVGIGLYRGSEGEMLFGLMSQSHPRSRRHGRLFSMTDRESALQEKVPIHGSALILPSLAVIGKAEP